MPQRVMVLNGPNLNLLGEREPDVYGRTTLADLRCECESCGRSLGLDVDFRQTNAEGQLVDWIQETRHGYGGLVINAGAYTHTSIAILDALRVLAIPIYEVHLSNIFRRESFRHVSYVSLAARGIISGFGVQGYTLALQALARDISSGRDLRA